MTAPVVPQLATAPDDSGTVPVPLSCEGMSSDAWVRRVYGDARTASLR
jgi:hypothetical protein